MRKITEKVDIVIFLLGVIVILFYHSPYLILGKDTFITPPFDSLDMLPLVRIPNYLFLPNNAVIPYMMGGVPRYIFYTELYYITILFSYLDPFWAWAINSIFISLIGFFGTYLMFSRYGNDFLCKLNLPAVNTQILSIISGIVAIYYALIPHWPWGGLSTSGIPLVVWAFINLIKNNNTILSWFIIVFYPFFSSFIYNGIFFIICLFAVLVIYQIIRKKFIPSINIAILLLIIISLITQYRVLLVELIDKLPTQRMDFMSGQVREHLTLWQHIKETILIFWENKFNYFTNNVNTFPRTDGQFIMIISFVVLIFLIINKKWDMIKILLVVLLVPYIFLTITTNPAIIKTPIALFFPSLKKTISSISIRFINLSPFTFSFFYFLLLITIYIITKNLNIIVIILILNTIYQFLFISDAPKTNNSFANNYIYNLKPSYKNYFDENLFSAIKQYIFTKYQLAPHQYKVLSIVYNDECFFPCIAQYNLFHTIDGYAPYIPYDIYKNFDILKLYYLKEDKKIRIFTNKRKMYFPVLNNNLFPLPPHAFRFLNTKKIFIFSIRPIYSPHIKFEKLFIGGYWKIYLYSMDIY